MGIKVKSIWAIVAISLLSGCSSNNIRAYRLDSSIKYDIPHSTMQKVYIKSVKMPENDAHSIMCRAVGPIYLPQKMTYSQYINDALHKTLISMDKLSDSPHVGHTLEIALTRVNFDTLAGEWYIDGNVIIDSKKSFTVNTTTQYGTAYIAVDACRNTAESFDEAVTNFIKKLLNQPDVAQALR
ncbi:hypothetical protein [Candidatus Odyssella thessalonicensis]|uniref:hypothetical protein n=1 Tax=Candidatus Odyssella thessalonicensis TaxID=84647 RepID=UPI000225C20F|nr:hypothetical protein [Candidatus Odyssella thessalonicensis]